MEINLLLDISHLVSMVIYFINLPFLSYTIFNITLIFHRMISIRRLKLSWLPISIFLGLVLIWYMLNLIQSTPGRDIDLNMVKVCWCFSLIKPTFTVTCRGCRGRQSRHRMVVGFITTTMYLCNQCLSPLMFWVWISLMTLCTIYNYWLLMRSTHDYTDLINDWLTEANGRGESIIDQVRTVMSRLKLKVNKCFIK